MKPLNFILAAALAVTTGGSAIAQSTNQSADPFAVSQDLTNPTTFGLAPGTVFTVVSIIGGIALLSITNGDGTTTTTTTAVVTP